MTEQRQGIICIYSICFLGVTRMFWGNSLAESIPNYVVASNLIMLTLLLWAFLLKMRVERTVSTLVVLILFRFFFDSVLREMFNWYAPLIFSLQAIVLAIAFAAYFKKQRRNRSGVPTDHNTQ